MPNPTPSYYKVTMKAPVVAAKVLFLPGSDRVYRVTPEVYGSEVETGGKFSDYCATAVQE